MGIRNEPKTGSTSLQNRLRVLYTLAKTLSALRAIESRRLRSIADSVTVAIPSYRLISLTLFYVLWHAHRMLPVKRQRAMQTLLLQESWQRMFELSAPSTREL